MTKTDIIAAGLKRRHAAERRFRAYGIAALLFAAAMLLTLLVTIIRPGISGFFHHEVRVEIDTAPIRTQLVEDPTKVDYYALTHEALRASAKGN